MNRLQRIWDENKLKLYRGVITSLAATAAVGVWTFYWDWRQDEAMEESVMFDSPEQKVRTVDHPVKVPTEAVLIHINSQEAISRELLDDVHKILDKQDRQDSINQKNHDQIFQIKEQLKRQ